MADNNLDKHLDTVTALTLRLKGQTYPQIAKHYGISKQAVHQRIKGVFKLIDPDKLEAYKTHKVNLLTSIEAELLGLIVKPDKLKQATLMQLATSFGIVYDKNRLEQGLSTSEIGIKPVLEEIRDNREKLMQALKSLEVGKNTSETVNITPDNESIDPPGKTKD